MDIPTRVKGTKNQKPIDNRVFRKIGERCGLAPVLVAISVAWIAALLPDIIGQVSLEEIFASISMRTRAVEEAREIGGLSLVILWAAVLWHRQRAAR